MHQFSSVAQSCLTLHDPTIYKLFQILRTFFISGYICWIFLMKFCSFAYNFGLFPLWYISFLRNLWFLCILLFKDIWFHINSFGIHLCVQMFNMLLDVPRSRFVVLGADCGSDHELLIAKFRLKLKKVGKTTRPFRYDLNKIPYDYTVEVRNRFKRLDLIECLMNYGWRSLTLYSRQGSRPSPWKRNSKKQDGCLGRSYK